MRNSLLILCILLLPFFSACSYQTYEKSAELDPAQIGGDMQVQKAYEELKLINKALKAAIANTNDSGNFDDENSDGDYFDDLIREGYLNQEPQYLPIESFAIRKATTVDQRVIMTPL